MRGWSSGLVFTVVLGGIAAAEPMRGWPFEAPTEPRAAAPPPPSSPFQRLRTPPERGRVRPYTAGGEAGVSYGLTRRARLDFGYRWAPPEHSAPAGPIGETSRGTFLGIRRSLGP